MNMFEVRQYGVRYCQCGLRHRADEIASMHPGRTVHLIVPPIEPETIDISAEDLGQELRLRGQFILDYDNRLPLDLQ